MKKQVSELSLDVHKLKKTALVIRAVNHPLRQKMLRLIHDKEYITVTDLYKTLKEEQSVTSQHLGILRKAGFVQTKRDGRSIFYSVNYDRLQELQSLMDNIL